MGEHRHHLPVVTVERHDGKAKVCPHCHQEVTEKSLYRDKKGWLFHRPCFAKGKGSIGMDKESNVLIPGALGAAIGGSIGASGKVPRITPLTGALIGGGLGLTAGMLMPPSGVTDPLSNLSPERREELERKFKRITGTLSRHGAAIGTHHPRAVVPHSYWSEQDLRDYGFKPSYLAVPEVGQSRMRTWRHPKNLYHFHEHPEGLTVHEDEDRFGLLHTIREGLPAYRLYRKRLKDPNAYGTIEAIMKENPRAVVKTAAEAPVIHEQQTTDYNCGPAVLKAVENSMGTGHPDQRTYEKETNTTDESGTPIVNLEQTAASHGHAVDAGKMDLTKLQQQLQAGKPVITAVQLDGPEGGPRGGWNSGHYVVVTGMDDKNVKFMDPNSDQAERVWPIQEFLSRWHDHDHQGNVYDNWGMALYHPEEVKKAEEKEEEPSLTTRLGHAALIPLGLGGAARLAQIGLERTRPSMVDYAHQTLKRPEIINAVAGIPEQQAALQLAVKNKPALMKMMAGRDVPGVSSTARKGLMDVVLGKSTGEHTMPVRQGDMYLRHGYYLNRPDSMLARLSQILTGSTGTAGHVGVVGQGGVVHDVTAAPHIKSTKQMMPTADPIQKLHEHPYLVGRPKRLTEQAAHAGGRDVVGESYKNYFGGETSKPYGMKNFWRSILREAVPELQLSGRHHMLDPMTAGCQPGDICSVPVQRSMEALQPGLLPAGQKNVTAPTEYERMMGKHMDVQRVNIPEEYRTPKYIYGQHYAKYGPMALRAIPAAALAGLGIYGAYKTLPWFLKKRQQVEEEKAAAEGSLGSGGDMSQTSDQAQVLDGSGSAPAGRSDQRPASEDLLDQCDQAPDPTLFDTVALDKVASGFLDDTMTVGTEETQEPLDDTGVARTGGSQVITAGWRDRLREMVGNLAYQDSGADGAGGRVFDPSGPANQSGVSIQQQPGASMQMDSDTISTGQPVHLNA